MYHEHLSLLVDPVTKEPLKLLSKKEINDEIIEGELISSTNRYPIHNGIVHFSDSKGSLKSYQQHQQSTADSFSYEWNGIYIENQVEKENFFHFLSPFIKPTDLLGKKILDAGCGSGRFTKQAALSKAKVVFGMDLGNSLDQARKLTQGLRNVCLIQGDIYQPPFNQSLDIVWSIGVLHHLPQPQLGFNSLTKCLKRKVGRILIWVYSRRNNKRALYLYEPLRAITRHIPKNYLKLICYLPAAIVHLFNAFELAFSSIKLPFSYYKKFPFSMKLNDAFDVLATPKSNYYYWEQIEDWFRDAKLKKVRSFEHPEAGITCIGNNE